METQKNNKQIQVEVREELAREPSVDSNAIGITADHGLIFLSGHVLGVTQRRTAVEAALRVEGVRAVIDELKIRPGRWGAHDADIASLAAGSLGRAIGLPDGRVKVVVRDGNVRLNGAVSGPEERRAIAATVRDAIGRGAALDNAILIDPAAIAILGPSPSPAPPIFAREPVAPPIRFEDPPPEASPMIIVNESFTDEGIPIRFVHHREFPEIRGEGETTSQGLALLARHLDRAREHARETWQREAIDRAIRDVRSYDSSLATETTSEMDGAGPDDHRGHLVPVGQPPMSLAVH